VPSRGSFAERIGTSIILPGRLAKRSILDQMVQGFARFAEGTDPVDDRLDRPAHDQRDLHGSHRRPVPRRAPDYVTMVE